MFDQRCCLAVGLLVGGAMLLPPAAHAASATAEAEYAGTETCAVCHEDSHGTFQRSIHASLKEGDWELTGCEACHGPGAQHAESGGELHMQFDSRNVEMTAKDRTEVCLGCHSDAGTFLFRNSEHMKGAVDCTSCHSPHAAAGRDRLLVEAGQEACLSCHEEIRGEATLYARHRVSEGMVKCADCHEQHAPSARTHLAGFDQANCTKCHTDKEGPFVFEHGASRVEGCTGCHDVHGSTNRHMLAYQNQADLCFSCHTVVPSFHAGGRFGSDTNCTNCHTQIHGSNLDVAMLK
jgi:DmsE family decaheme c-type cytochrome